MPFKFSVSDAGNGRWGAICIVLLCIKRERGKVQQEPETLVEATYSSMLVKPGKYQCVLHYHFGVINSILDYATYNDCHLICIGTHGAGKVLRLLGVKIDVRVIAATNRNLERRGRFCLDLYYRLNVYKWAGS